MPQGAKTKTFFDVEVEDHVLIPSVCEIQIALRAKFPVEKKSSVSEWEFRYVYFIFLYKGVPVTL